MREDKKHTANLCISLYNTKKEMICEKQLFNKFQKS